MPSLEHFSSAKNRLALKVIAAHANLLPKAPKARWAPSAPCAHVWNLFARIYSDKRALSVSIN